MRSLLAILMLLAWPALAEEPPLAANAHFTRPVLLGEVKRPVLREISGLAASRRQDGMLWVHNDSGGEPAIYALAANGELLATCTVEGARNVDWEDMAAFRLKDEPYLLLADVGDNRARRREVRLYIVREPEVVAGQATLTVPIAWQITFTWPDGPRDCESVAVAAEEGRIYLLSKRTEPPVLYSLPLQPEGDAVLQARLEAPVPWFGLAANQALEAMAPRHGRIARQPTAMDFSPDGRSAVILTYLYAFHLERAPEQSWRDAFAQRPTWLPMPLMRQREAICFAADGSAIIATSEGIPAPIHALTPAPPNPRPAE